MSATNTGADGAGSTTHRRPGAFAGPDGAARVALIFSAITLTLMVANAIAARRIDPAKANALIALQHDLTLRPNDERLRARVRAEDMRVRRDFNRHRDFAVRGAWILLGGIVTYLVASAVARRRRLPAPTPRPDASERARRSAEATFRAVVGVGGVMAGTLVTLTVVARHDSLAEYARAAGRPSQQIARPAPGAGPAGAALPVATAQGGTVSAPQPVGGTLSGTGTTLVPLPTGGSLRPSGPIGPAPNVASRPPVKLTAALGPDWAQNWPRFRGPEGTGAAADRTPPMRWDGAKGEGIVWKTPIPLPGWNSPVVWGERVFLSGADATKREVYAFDMASGALVWRTAIPLPAGVPVPKVHADTGHAPATLATDGARICAMFVTGDVTCLDMAGKIVWSRSLGPIENAFGHATSPILFGSGVILQIDQGHGDDAKSALMALDLVTGKTVWQVERKLGSAWSTPIIVVANGSEQLITTANPFVIAYDPHNGKELWRAEVLGGEVAISPVFGEGYVLVANQGSNSAAIRPDGSGDVTKTSVAWTAGDGLPDIVSPVVFGDLMLLTATEGWLTAVEVKTGKKAWEGDIAATVRASPVFAGGRIYLTDSDGVTHILDPGRAFKVLARCPLGEDVNASAAFVGSRILIRGRKHLFCIGEK
jgi:outer membrane protein assembly factor BamB